MDNLFINRCLIASHMKHFGNVRLNHCKLLKNFKSKSSIPNMIKNMKCSSRNMRIERTSIELKSYFEVNAEYQLMQHLQSMLSKSFIFHWLFLLCCFFRNSTHFLIRVFNGLRILRAKIYLFLWWTRWLFNYYANFARVRIYFPFGKLKAKQYQRVLLS